MQEPTTNDAYGNEYGLYCKAQPDLPNNEDTKERGDRKDQSHRQDSDNKSDKPVPFPVPEVDPT